MNEPHDLIITDVSMPALDGFELIDNLRRSGVATRIIAATAQHTSIENVVRLMRLGVCDVLNKNEMGERVLVDHVTRALALASPKSFAESPRLIDELEAKIQVLRERLLKAEKEVAGTSTQNELIWALSRLGTLILLIGAMAGLWAVGAMHDGNQLLIALGSCALICLLPWGRVTSFVLSWVKGVHVTMNHNAGPLVPPDKTATNKTSGSHGEANTDPH